MNGSPDTSTAEFAAKALGEYREMLAALPFNEFRSVESAAVDIRAIIARHGDKGEVALTLVMLETAAGK